MSRQDGFEIADTDTGMLADPKVLSLARRLHNSSTTGAAIALYDAVRLASWKAGRRLTLDETVPGWWLDPVEDLGDALVAVGLLDDDRRIPTGAWEGWFGAARDRRQRFRVLGSKGGKAAHALSEMGVKSALDHTPERTLDPTPEPTVDPKVASEHTVEHTVEPVRPSVRPDNSPLPPVRRGDRNGLPRGNGTSPRAQGDSRRQLREGTPDVDRRALQRLGDLLPHLATTVETKGVPNSGEGQVADPEEAF